MSEDQPLSEFSSTDSTANGDTAEPATVTYRWQSDGAVCEQCETSTEKQWLDDAQFVCPDCKSWD
ncbi:hypothetical protein halTADL_1145 [Halohasta litchfieldiae]|jgi:Zn finger protein HypA/HybF involved in hydrogenase expression|uniref:DUF7573 domain-containing protein n=1 Tax=Halohasta litchfieldiae TaxID=1073996 RepID=A0A1H6S1Z9_9EURY|nr:hypothetical protein [Halohasta litchfieldiae]ATW87938.1 hypothetical protein halTADL_1145 [Halohasta litchfieldiae]SEI61919.1 hypothetical protein SAMN05444271_10450 [Halohasta litchfieldiae]